MGLLGDANFPTFALGYFRDGRQLFVQHLFEKYSTLAFTEPMDRSVGLLGMQKRIERVFDTPAAYGVFHAYFARGLLWRRGGDALSRMEPIPWPSGHRVPSWSWLSKRGPIKYLDLVFERVDWSDDEFEKPLPRQRALGTDEKERQEDTTVLRGQAKLLLLTEDDRKLITFDTKDNYDLDRLRCLVVGRDQSHPWEKSTNVYTIIIHPRSELDDQDYERVGMAILKRSHIRNDENWVNIR